jgi:dTDP-4-amino-4,6-dideoxygalactose transaminase
MAPTPDPPFPEPDPVLLRAHRPEQLYTLPLENWPNARGQRQTLRPFLSRLSGTHYSKAPTPNVPVMAPLLPPADRLLPYLRRIDASRTYTNFGPLVLELEERLAAQLSLARGGLVTASSGTAALVGAILATAGRATAARPFALIPAYTFVATAVAAELCGYKPFLADVDPETWLLQPEHALEHPDLSEVGLVVPVGAYGIGVPQAAWRNFRLRTGIPVVIDGAASFEAVCSNPATHLGDIPVAMSFHATKSFSCGEGGAVACSDSNLVLQIGTALNFGFCESRDSRSASLNGKLSEYHAAVGLAELDAWQEKTAAFGRVAATYRRLFDARGFGGKLTLAPDVCSSYVLMQCSDPEESRRVQRNLATDRIGVRLWYGDGLHRQPHFDSCRRTDLDVTDLLAPLILGLPMAVDLSELAIERVALAAASDGNLGAGL